MNTEQPRQLTVSWRYSAWSAFLGLTILILMYPTGLNLELSQNSSDIFLNPQVFGVLFYLWMFILLVLLFTAVSGTPAARWEGLWLIAVAALVFRGFWNIIAPMELEAITRNTTTRIWEAAGHMVSGPAVAYSGWPGTSLLSIVLSRATGLDIFRTGSAIPVAISIAIGLAAYIFLLTVLTDTLAAGLASLLIIAGNVAMVVYLQPGPLAVPFVVFFLAMLFRKRTPESSSIWLVVLLLLGATVTHFHNALHFFFIALGIWGLDLLRHRPTESAPSAAALIVLFAIPTMWILYWGVTALIWISLASVTTFLDLHLIVERLTSIFTIGKANFGETVPGWYQTTRLVWLIVLYAMGGALGIWNLLRIRRVASTEAKLVGGLVGVGVLEILTSLVSPSGFAELLRGATFIPFFTVPLMLLFIRRFGPIGARVGLVAFACLLLVSSLPTFFSNNIWINSSSDHPIEFAAGRWLESSYGNGQGQEIFATSSTYPPIKFYVPSATYVADRQNFQLRRWTEQGLWQSQAELLDRFDDFSARGNRGLFVQSPREALVRSSIFGVPYTDPHWSALARRLAQRHDRVYDNGAVRMYSSEGYTVDHEPIAP